MRLWTIEERRKQALLIQQWQPWRQSTVAKTADEKSTSKMNAYKHVARSAEVRDMARQLTEYKKILTQLIGII